MKITIEIDIPEGLTLAETEYRFRDMGNMFIRYADELKERQEIYRKRFADPENETHDPRPGGQAG